MCSSDLRGLHEHPWGELLLHAAIIGGVVIVTRLLWVFPGAYLPRWLNARIRTREPFPPVRNVAVLGWCGMRGVVSLAAALAVPRLLPDGREFPERDLVLFFTFAVILMTLVGQGLTLPWLIHRLGVSGDHAEDHAERDARRAATKAALTRIEEFASQEKLTAEAITAVTAAYQERLHHLGDELAEALGWSPTRQRSIESRRLRREALAAEREHLIALHRQHRVSKELLHKLERELDLEEARLG